MNTRSTFASSPMGKGRRARALAPLLHVGPVGRGVFKLLATRPSIRYFLSKSFVGPVDAGLASYAYLAAHVAGAERTAGLRRRRALHARRRRVALRSAARANARRLRRRRLHRLRRPRRGGRAQPRVSRAARGPLARAAPVRADRGGRRGHQPRAVARRRSVKRAARSHERVVAVTGPAVSRPTSPTYIERTFRSIRAHAREVACR